jgi:hypothetical protein
MLRTSAYICSKPAPFRTAENRPKFAGGTLSMPLKYQVSFCCIFTTLARCIRDPQLRLPWTALACLSEQFPSYTSASEQFPSFTSASHEHVIFKLLQCLQLPAWIPTQSSRSFSPSGNGRSWRVLLATLPRTEASCYASQRPQRFIRGKGWTRAK